MILLVLQNGVLSTSKSMVRDTISSEKTIESFLEQSQCLEGWLHRFVIVDQYFDGVLERCEICGQEEFFQIIDGRVNNENYLAYHARQALLPQHELYIHEYGK